MADRKRKKQSRSARRSNQGPGSPRRVSPKPKDPVSSVTRAGTRRGSAQTDAGSSEGTVTVPGKAVEGAPGLVLGDLSHVSQDLARSLALAATMLVLLAAATVALG